MRKYVFCLLAIASMWLTSCSLRDLVYSQVYPISSEQWHIDSVVRFEVPITDISATYRTIVYVRHSERYPYQNMWLFVGNETQRDTIEFYLADDRGRWLGDRHNGIIEMPVLLDENRHFSGPGTYVFEIQHGMRDTLLRGVTDIGLEVIRNGEK